MSQLTELERERTREWLRALRGRQSQDAIADAMSAAFPDWSITRDRYSKYESGATPFGRTVYQRFVDFWTARGEDPPDLTPPAPVLSIEERTVRALEDAARAAERQAAAMETLVAITSAGLSEQARNEVAARMLGQWAERQLETRLLHLVGSAAG